jgi:hypothetical protein
MAMTTKSTLKTLMFAAASIVLGALPLRAHEIETGPIMICDTQAQVERFVTLFDGNTQNAIVAVNSEEQNPTACAIADIHYVSGPEVGTVRSRTDAFRIVPIIAVGVSTPMGPRSVKPAIYFTLVKVKEFAV